MSLLKSQAYINGEWVDAVGKTTFDVKTPADGETAGTVPNMDAVDAEKAIIAANQAFKTWGASTDKEKSILLKKWYDLIKENAEEVVEILRIETGKSLAEATMELDIAVGDLEFFAEGVKKIDDWIPNKVYVKRQPLGVVGLITPRYFSLALSVKKMATALGAACTCVRKPAEYTPVLAVVELAHQAGFPKGVINVITSDRPNTSAVGKALCSSLLIAGISFTGSTQVGRTLYGQFSPYIRRIALELNGNSPFLVFNSATIDKAVQCGIRSTFLKCGEICAAAYIFLVQEDVHDQFFEAMKNIKAGVTIGPLINKTQFQRLCFMVDDVKSKGANVLVGGRLTTKSGELFHEPTLITDVKKDMQLFRDEIIGPVASVMKFKTEEEGVALANDTKTELVAYFFTEDVGQIYRIGKLLQAAKIKVNDALTICKNGSFLRRIKHSGIGKEGTFYGVDEYCYFHYHF